MIERATILGSPSLFNTWGVLFNMYRLTPGIRLFYIAPT